MDDATRQALNAFLQQAIEAAKLGATWTGEQAPLLVQEWLRWKLIDASFWTVFGLVLTVCLYKIVRWQISKIAGSGPFADWGVGALITGVGGSLFPGMMLIYGISTIMQVIFAPRVMVLTELAKLVGGK